MAKTWQNLLDEARVILQDTDEPYRYSNTVVRAVLNRGIQELARLRPDAFWDLFDGDDVVVPEIALSDPDVPVDPAYPKPADFTTMVVGDNFPLPMMFYGPLVYWIAGSAELTDDEFTNDGRAMTLLTQFKAMVVAL